MTVFNIKTNPDYWKAPLDFRDPIDADFAERYPRRRHHYGVWLRCPELWELYSPNKSIPEISSPFSQAIFDEYYDIYFNQLMLFNDDDLIFNCMDHGPPIRYRCALCRKRSADGVCFPRNHNAEYKAWVAAQRGPAE